MQTLVSLEPVLLSLHLVSDKFANNLPVSPTRATLHAGLASGSYLFRVGH